MKNNSREIARIWSATTAVTTTPDTSITHNNKNGCKINGINIMYVYRRRGTGGIIILPSRVWAYLCENSGK
jgi:hypothetical protein